MPSVSVIIPTYNRDKYISIAIDSVLNQSYQNFEIIIVDDGSTDTTKEIIAGYIREYGNKIRYFFQDNKGPGGAKNLGIRESKGKYITFLDSDDKLLKESLEERVAFLEQNPDVYLVFTDYYDSCYSYGEYKREGYLASKNFLKRLRESGNYFYESQVIIHGLPYIFFERTRFPISTITVMLKNKVVETVGFFREDVQIAEDIEFWYRITKNHKIGFINLPLSIYCNHLEGVTKDSRNFNLDSIKIYEEMYAKEEGKSKKLLKNKLANLCFDLGYFYCIHKNKKCAREFLYKSVKFDSLNWKTYKVLLSSYLPSNLYKLLKK